MARGPLPRLLAAPDLPDAHRRVYEARLKDARRELDAARADLDRQRKVETDAWAKPRGLRVDWSMGPCVTQANGSPIRPRTCPRRSQQTR